MYESKSLVALVKAYGRHQYTLGQLSMINAPTGRKLSREWCRGEASSNLKDHAILRDEIPEGRDYPFREIAIRERQLSKDILNDIFHRQQAFEDRVFVDEFTG